MPESAQQPPGMPDDRWQDLIRSMDPVANLNALADVWRQAAASSEQVVSGFVAREGEDPASDAATNPGPFSGRDVRIDFERSVDQMAEAAKRFFGQLPWGMGGVGEAAEPKTTVTVLDGVGSTEVALPAGVVATAAGDAPWATGLVRHDGARISSSQVTIRATSTFGQASVDPEQARFIVKIMVDEAIEPGVYHGLILCPGAVDFMLPLEARVHPPE